jgi:peroxiredoxin
MTTVRRALYLSGAAMALIAALLLLNSAGLPQRADFTGGVPRTPGTPHIAPEIQSIAPDFTLQATTGATFRLGDTRGNPVILNFWATWCGPCAIEMPILQSVFETYQDKNLQVVAVNIGESVSAVQQWQQTHQLTYPLLLDHDQRVAAAYQLRGQPSTYIMAPDGIITHIFFGPVTEAAITAALETLW